MRALLVLVIVGCLGCGSNSVPAPGGADRVQIATPDADTAGAAGSGAAAAVDADAADQVLGAGGAAGAASSWPQPLADPSIPIAGMSLDSFDTAVDLGFEPQHDSVQTNLADSTRPDAGPAPAMTFDGDDGSPLPGSMAVSVPFSGPNQYVKLQSYVYLVPQDWSGHALHVRLKVDPGSIFTGLAQLYVDTGTSYIAASAAVALAPGSGWQEIAMDLDHPMTVSAPDRYSAKQVVLYGLALTSGSAGDGATPATFHVDSFSLD